MKEEEDQISQLLLKKFKFRPTFGQAKLFKLMDSYLEDESVFRHIFILRGYAGTGKTTFLSALIQSLPKFGWKSILMAPTGRAAKVMSLYSKRNAVTIHKKIY
ncbi:MAG: AAA family ATPase, partial [Spirosomataceae bacterium]